MDVSDNVVYDDNGNEIYKFIPPTEEELLIDEKIEKRLNSLFGAKGAICMDEKTKLKPSEPIDYGPIKDIAGNIVDQKQLDYDEERKFRLFH
jgi:hypothetical protein